MANASACPSQFLENIKKNREALQDCSSPKGSAIFNFQSVDLSAAGRVVGSDPEAGSMGQPPGRNDSGATMKK
jgi:hypothetical protein